MRVESVGRTVRRRCFNWSSVRVKRSAPFLEGWSAGVGKVVRVLEGWDGWGALDY